ncbi:hypothetical protein [Jeotgalibaca porci]|uniref:hypothetical protein n=1 Tax=Jeotgalibaca porci TaxID=1868793 RepID=UPI0035A1491C
MNLQEELKALKERIVELEEQVEKEGGKEFPQDGDGYWYIDTTGDVYDENWECFSFEKATLEIGNVFKTKEQAEFAVEKLKVEAELRKFSRPIDYEDRNWAILWDIDKKSIETRYNYGMVRQGTIYFESKEKAQQAIEAVGEERIKKYIFGVEELNGN